MHIGSFGPFFRVAFEGPTEPSSSVRSSAFAYALLTLTISDVGSDLHESSGWSVGSHPPSVAWVRRPVDSVTASSRPARKPSYEHLISAGRLVYLVTVRTLDE